MKFKENTKKLLFLTNLANNLEDKKKQVRRLFHQLESFHKSSHRHFKANQSEFPTATKSLALPSNKTLTETFSGST
jgi:hypothetical protein